MREVFFECKILAQKIVDFKKRNNLTYQQLGEALGVDKSYLNRVVKMDTYPSLPVLIRLAKFIGIPLYALFIPSENLIREEFIAAAKSRLAQLTLSVEQLSEATGISPIRLMDIFEGNTALTTDECTHLASALDIPDNAVFQEDKLNMLENIVSGLELQDTQKDNILKYVKENLK